MALLKRDKRARSGREASGSVGEIRDSVRGDGAVSGQLAVGSHIVQMRVDTVLGNLVTVLPQDAKANVTPRPVPISLVPRRPALLMGRQRETTLAVEALARQACGRAIRTGWHGEVHAPAIPRASAANPRGVRRDGPSVRPWPVARRSAAGAVRRLLLLRHPGQAPAGRAVMDSAVIGPALRRTNGGGARRDIQGLRALAVVAVIAEHLFHWPAGGFVG